MQSWFRDHPVLKDSCPSEHLWDGNIFCSQAIGKLSIPPPWWFSGMAFCFPFFFKNFWCRYLCPYGALWGLFSMISPSRIYRYKTQCINCGNCSLTCPSFLPVSKKTTIRSPECTGCLDCINVCPVEDALAFSSTGFPDRKWSHRKVGLLIMLSFILSVYIAGITGHWRSSVSDHEFRIRFQTLDAPDNTHPTIDFWFLSDPLILSKKREICRNAPSGDFFGKSFCFSIGSDMSKTNLISHCRNHLVALIW